MEGLFQPMHLLVIFVIALFIFGPKRLPELGKGLGDGIRALKEGLREQPPTSSATATDSAAAANKDKSPTETKS